MKRSIVAVALAGMFFATPVVDARGRGGSRNYRSGAGGWYGHRAGLAVVDRTLSDLRRAASRNRVDGHERDHFRRAMSELETFRYRIGDGRFEERRLNRAIEDLEHLSNARQIHPGDRRTLARDMYDLQQLRNWRDESYRR